MRRRGHRRLRDEEVVRLLAHCVADVSPRGARDAALVAVGVACGLRASEHAALQLADYDRAGRRLRIPQIKVETSADDVWLPLPSPVVEYLDRWLAWRGATPGALFTRAERGGLGVIQQMAPDSITEIIKDRAAAAGVERVTAHDLRATCVTRFLEATGDTAMASQLARHMSLATIKLYDKRDLGDLRRLVERVPWPGEDVERGARDETTS
jgi:integrase